MIKPSIHLNGSAASVLAEGYEAAYRALGEAQTALYATFPNARDYYVQGPLAFEQARSEYETRVRTLTQVRDELLALFTHVEDAAARRKAGR